MEDGENFDVSYIFIRVCMSRIKNKLFEDMIFRTELLELDRYIVMFKMCKLNWFVIFD